MGLRAGVGTSRAIDGRQAVREALAVARRRLGDVRPSLCLLFAAARYQQDALLEALGDQLGADVAVSGCSAEGVLADGRSDERERVLGLMLLGGDSVRFTPFLVEGYDRDPADAARRLIAELRAVAGPTARGLWLLPDGVAGDALELVDALADALPHLTLVGGLAGDGMEMRRTWQYGGRRAVSGAVAAILVEGDVDLVTGVSHGCTPIGVPHTVTLADGPWVRALDDRPAWDVFREYLGGAADDFNADGISHVCLAEMVAPDDPVPCNRLVVHTPMRLDRETGAMLFPAGGLAAGRTVHFVRRDPEQVRRSAELSGHRVALALGGRKAALVLQFDCAGRGRIMFGQNAAEFVLTPLQAHLGVDTPWLGFHSFGEIAPLRGRARCHTYTVALCALVERAPASTASTVGSP